ncbi:MAG: prephenate dehydratase [Fimbriimonadaceae bacterium]|nr:prephenate dehydratase [Fimbriimonadaceae bacterium]QYK56305.1 MAG: prephenate dehydratase [Fimbriimonadaceae bacterium]
MEDRRTVKEARNDIDAVDAEIVRLLGRRAELAQEIGRLKGDRSQPYFTPEREHQIFQRLASIPAGPLRPAQVTAIFREIISAARAAEKPMSVAYWGPPGTFSHMAGVQTFGRSTELAPVDSISEVFRKVESHQADYGIVPIENSIAGVVPETLDSFPVTNVKICGETFLAVHHCLASGGTALGEVQRVYAGPQPHAQCRRWLAERLPHAEVVSVAPTTRAAEMALADANGAAVVNHMAVELMALTLLAENIEDATGNRTRFVVLGFNEPAPTGSDKTSVMFNLRNRPGELYRVLGAFDSHQVNLMMIESRPAPRASFEYLFYVDCGGHRTDANLAAALVEIRKQALETTVLGSYPSTDPSLNTP